VLPWALRGIQLQGDVLEIGPGPGLVTDHLVRRGVGVVSVEIDAELARNLRARFQTAAVAVVNGDATRLPFADAQFDFAVSFTMLHHVPSPALQDRLLAETRRVLRPGGVFAGSDSRDSRMMRLLHVADTLVPVDPDGFGERLRRAGFHDVEIEPVPRAFRFRAA
jgi:SAM-dependent methyltransferase